MVTTGESAPESGNKAVPASLNDATSMIRTDITLLVIQARSSAATLYRRLARNDGSVTNAFSDFAEIFYQLFMAFKFNAFYVSKIKDWEKKVVVYDNLFYNQIMSGKMPANILVFFDAFMADLVNAGIYNLTSSDYIGRKY